MNGRHIYLLAVLGLLALTVLTILGKPIPVILTKGELILIGGVVALAVPERRRC